jgi:RimJ/RimL family protein N-acetyltransferase
VALADRDAGELVPFVVVDRRTGKAIGSTRFLPLRPEHRGLEIGWTWNASGAWGSGANAEAKLLLLRHAFETLGCMRVEFKTDALNARSRAALEALPARFEGIFAKHMLVRDGAVRDSAYYAITDDEWPAVRANLERRLRSR